MHSHSRDGLETKVFGERTLYDNYYVRLGMVDIEPPDGRRFEHHVVHLHRSAVALLVNERDQVLMQWRHRFAIGKWGYEFLGGLVEHDQDPETTARREAEEESGWRPLGPGELLSTFDPVPGMVTGDAHIYRWTSFEQVGEPTDLEEASHLEWVPIAELAKLVRSGELLGAASVISALCLLQYPIDRSGS